MNHLYIIEFRVDGGEWYQFDYMVYSSSEDASAQVRRVADSICEFRVVKYQRVEGE